MLKKVFSLVLAVLLAAGLAMPALALEYEDDERVRNIRISNSSVRLKQGDPPMQLFVRFSPSGTSEEVYWESSDENIVTVDDDGYIEAGEETGSAIITVESERELRATCRVTVVGERSDDAISRVRLNFDELSVRVGQTRQLIADISPSNLDEEDQYVYWETDDADIAEVQQDGTVYGRSPGTTTITAASDNGKKDSCRVTVVESDPRISDAVSGRATGSTAGAAAPNTVVGTLTTSAVRGAVEQEAGSTASGAVGTATFIDNGVITPALMNTAASAAGAKNVMLRFATTGENEKRNGYLTLDPKVGRELKNNVYTSVFVDGKEVDAAESTFDKYYQNQTAIIGCAQSGSFGLPVTIQARADFSGMKTDNLAFYSYANNKVTRLDVASYSVDTNGFLRFGANVGGIIVVSDGPLVKK